MRVGVGRLPDAEKGSRGLLSRPDGSLDAFVSLPLLPLLSLRVCLDGRQIHTFGRGSRGFEPGRRWLSFDVHRDLPREAEPLAIGSRLRGLVLGAIQVSAHPVRELDPLDLIVGKHLAIDLLCSQNVADHREQHRIVERTRVPMLVARDLDVTVHARVVPDLVASIVRVHSRRKSIEPDRPPIWTLQRTCDEAAAMQERHQRDERREALRFR